MPTPQFLAEPAIEPGPVHAPLVAWPRVRASGADQIRVRIERNGDAGTITFPAAEGCCLLLGFHPEGVAKAVVQIAGLDGAVTWPTKIAHRLKDVPTSPIEEPPLQTHVSQPHRMAGQFTFLTVRRRAMGRITDMTVAQRKRLTHWGMLVAVDDHGRMRWMRKLDRRAAGIEHLASGNLFVHDTESCSREIDVAGNVTRAWFAAQRPQGAEEGGIPADVRGLHHQPHQMPNGNFLALSAHAGRVKVWPASVREPDKHKADREIVGDMVVEFTPEGEVVWSWDSFDPP